MKRTYKILMLLLVMVTMFGVCRPQAMAASKLTVKKDGSQLIVKSGSKVTYTCKYKKETVKTTKKIAVRTGPSADYDKFKTVAKGKKLTRVGKLSEKKWDIIKIDKKYYFAARSNLKKVSSSSSSSTVIDLTGTSSAGSSGTVSVGSGANDSPRLYEPSYFRQMGVINWGGHRWTWYSQRVLPGGGLVIPGRHVDSDGYVVDSNGYLSLASEDYPYGTVVNTPFGKRGVVRDSGCDYGTLDVYVNW